MTAKKILVTGAFGLVGSDLVPKLQTRFGKDTVIAIDNKPAPTNLGVKSFVGDVRDLQFLDAIIKDNKITDLYHLAGLLSAGGEKIPDLAWDINITGLRNILELARNYNFKIFWPSSIAAFGPTTPKINTPQHTSIEPTTIYGITKLTGELLCQYYFKRWGVDVRSLRYPGLTGYKAPPGDGTTEYSVHIFYGLLDKNEYSCYLKPNTRLPMMYMDDAINGTIKLMEAPSDKISIRTSYNFSGINFTPKEIVDEITKLSPSFKCTYIIDPNKQAIADSWPESIDDSQARTDWGWKHEFDLEKMTKVMIDGLKEKLGKNS